MLGWVLMEVTGWSWVLWDVSLGGGLELWASIIFIFWLDINSRAIALLLRLVAYEHLCEITLNSLHPNSVLFRGDYCLSTHHSVEVLRPSHFIPWFMREEEFKFVNCGEKFLNWLRLNTIFFEKLVFGAPMARASLWVWDYVLEPPFVTALSVEGLKKRLELLLEMASFSFCEEKHIVLETVFESLLRLSMRSKEREDCHNFFKPDDA